MRKVLKLAAREYDAAVRSKAFIVMLVLMPIMMGGGILVMKIMEDRVDTRDRHVAVIDHTGQVAGALQEVAEQRNATAILDPESQRQVKPKYIIEPVTPQEDDLVAQRLELSDRVREGALHAFLEISANAIDDPGEAELRYYAKNAAVDDVRQWCEYNVNPVLRQLRARQAGLDPETTGALLSWVDVEGLGLVSVDEQTGQVGEAEKTDEARALAVPAAMMMLMFMLIAVGATPLLNSTLEEKMQRIAEVLLGSARPFELMAGKLLGTLAVSYTVLAVYLVGGLATMSYLDVLDYVPFDLLPWFVVYLTAALLMFGALFAAIGAACNDLKEAQSMMMPVWLLVMLPLFVWMPVLREPDSPFATWVSLFPPSVPMLMLLRQCSPVGVPWWQPWVGLAGTGMFTLLCIWAGGRIFRIGILLQGQPPKLGMLLRWAVRG